MVKRSFWGQQVVKPVKIYVEGGGDSRDQQARLRKAMIKLLERAGFKNRMPNIEPCGPRNRAYKNFSVVNRGVERPLLLVDSEAPVQDEHQSGDAKSWKPWEHLKDRPCDGWKQPEGSSDLDCHLMVQATEAWLIADVDNLKSRFGDGFKADKLKNLKVEQLDKDKLNQLLHAATFESRAGAYKKGADTFQILATTSPDKIKSASPWAKRFFDHLEEVCQTV